MVSLDAIRDYVFVAEHTGRCLSTVQVHCTWLAGLPFLVADAFDRVGHCQFSDGLRTSTTSNGTQMAHHPGDFRDHVPLSFSSAPALCVILCFASIHEPHRRANNDR